MGRLIVQDPLIARPTIEREWQSVLSVLLPDIRKRMALEVETPANVDGDVERRHAQPRPVRPNYRYEVVRQLLAARIEACGAVTYSELANRIGVSLTAVQKALKELVNADLVRAIRRGAYELGSSFMGPELLARVNAKPKVMCFRFQHGRHKSHEDLIRRFVELKSGEHPTAWRDVCLSGIPVAQVDFKRFNLWGTPRLDLTACIRENVTYFSPEAITDLYQGLEWEPNPFAHPPVIVTFVHGGLDTGSYGSLGDVPRAHPADVYLAIEDIGLAEQAHEYLKAMESGVDVP